MIFLVNKPKKSKSRAKGASKSKTQRKARKSSAKKKTRRIGGLMAVKKKKARRKVARKAAPKRRRRKAGAKRSSITLRRVSGKVYRTNGRRRYRRNATYSRSGVVGTLMAGAKDAAGVLGGVVGTNFISSRIPFGEGNRGFVAAKKLAVAVALGMVAQRAMGRAVAQNIVAGGVAAVAMDFLRDVPVIGSSLSGSMTINGLGLYPTNLLNNGVGAYPFTGDTQVVDSARLYRN